MKLSNISIMIIVLACILVTGCSRKTEDDEITSVIFENLKFAENEDLEGCMATIHEQSPTYAVTEKQMEQIFDIYDLKYKMESVKVIEKSSQEAVVEYVQITSKENGPEFRDNKVKGTHTLKKSNGKWKLYSSEITSIEYLD